jgi:hypothetical protein
VVCWLRPCKCLRSHVFADLRFRFVISGSPEKPKGPGEGALVAGLNDSLGNQRRRRRCFCVDQAGTVAHQATCFCKFTRELHGGYPVGGPRTLHAVVMRAGGPWLTASRVDAASWPVGAARKRGAFTRAHPLLMPL